MSDERLKEVCLYAWIGEDEHGSGEIGLKQHWMPCGLTPLVAVKREKIDSPVVEVAMGLQARGFGKRIRLVKFAYAEVLKETEAGE